MTPAARLVAAGFMAGVALCAAFAGWLVFDQLEAEWDVQ